MCFAIPCHPCICSNSAFNWHKVRMLQLLYVVCFGKWWCIVKLWNLIFWPHCGVEIVNGSFLMVWRPQVPVPPPRKVIEHQCIQHKSVLKAICDYVSIQGKVSKYRLELGHRGSGWLKKQSLNSRQSTHKNQYRRISSGTLIMLVSFLLWIF